MGKSIKVLALVKSDSSSSSIREACHSLNGTPISLQIVRDPDALPGNGTAPDMLLVEVDPSDTAEVVRLDGVLRHRFPGTPIVATADHAGVQDVRKFMRLGIADFLPQPLSRSDLLAAVHHARDLKSRAGAGGASGRIVTFIKGGGGVGATTLAVQLGCQLVPNRKNKRKVALFDLDHQFGSAGLYLDLGVPADVMEIAETPDRMDADLLDGVMVTHDSGLRVMPAPEDIRPLDAFSPQFVETLLQLGASTYDYLLIDLPQAWTDWCYAVLQQSDLIVLVTTMSVGGLYHARQQLRTLEAQGLSDIKVMTVLNRMEKGWGTSSKKREAEKILGRGVDHVIPENAELMNEATNRGVQLSKITKRTKVEKSIAGLVGSIQKMIPHPASKEPRLLH